MVIIAIVLGVTVVLAILAAVVCIPTFNAVERGRASVQESLSNVDVFLCQRHDLTVQVVNVVKGYMAHEKKILFDTTAMRRSGKTVMEMEKSSSEIDEMLSKIQATAEAYPDLRSSDLFIKLMDSIENCEVNLESARRLFNSNASLFNSSRHEIPTCFFAKKYAPYDLFRCESYKRDLPTISF